MTKILLSFDLEEFNLPLEYSENISESRQFEITYRGVKRLQKILDKHEISVTFFVTASFALRYPKLLKKLSEKHEIASHGLDHSQQPYDWLSIKQSKEIIEKVIGKKIDGFRFPRLKKPDFRSLKKIGFKYDSSICPTFLPGRYQHYFERRTVHLKEGIIEVPISTTPLIKFPLYWLFFKSFGKKYSKIITSICTKSPGFTNLFFHPWEFVNLDRFSIPFYIKRGSGKKSLLNLEEYVLWCKGKNYMFLTFSEFLSN